MSKNEDIQEFSVKKLFKGDASYLIPIYQRSFAWGKGEVEQLVRDIDDFAKDNDKKNKSYYIGTLIVFERESDGKKIYETIDGQQRITTLSILLSVLKNEFKLDIDFRHLLKYESREISTKTLHYIYNGDIEEENLNPAMENAYKVLKHSLSKINNIGIFREYLLNNVKILRVRVPKDTDLNHYFEVMNNRGEQLEKHEVLKALLLEKLNNDQERTVFNQIWEACADMNRYVQYGFESAERDKLFGNEWNCIECKDFDDIENTINVTINKKQEDTSFEEQKNFTIDEIIQNKPKDPNTSNDKEKPDRFNSPINFPNFLLQVLKVTSQHNVPLDDKRLLESFNMDTIDEKFVKNFGYNLLKLRFLFDNYVIKREYVGEKDRWSLLQVYKYINNGKQNIQYKNRFDDGENRQVLMLLSMFHVSNPSQIYKYWLASVLNFLSQSSNNIKSNEYIRFLEELAEKFFKKYISKNQITYDEIIFLPCTFSYVVDKTLLDRGTSVEHFIFNYLDYLLWKENLQTKKRKYEYFNFSFSNSVEHFYPQNSINPLSDKRYLDNFGNLCLISVSVNAKLNNHSPLDKKGYYEKNRNGKYDSLKQHIMMEKADNWDESTIKQHANDMRQIFRI